MSCSRAALKTDGAPDLQVRGTNRRDFLRQVCAGTAVALPFRDQSPRRQATIGGRRVRVVDMHAHCVIPVAEVVAGTPLAGQGGGAGANLLGPGRLQVMLIFDGTFDRFPGLRVCAAHAGDYLPSYLGRTEAACVVRANANCANRKKPSEYLRSQILVDTMVFSEEGLRHLVAEAGVGQVVYGTDVPFNWPVTVDLVLNAPFLRDADKEAILGGNLVRLLRL